MRPQADIEVFARRSNELLKKSKPKYAMQLCLDAEALASPPG
tara:strand:+ start:18450 stop:18575 length:126 start_codon:yes stop_codon:yes gene_type:complete